MRELRDDVTAASVQDGVARAREQVAAAARRSGRTPDAVTIVAAVKYVDTKACRLLVEAGVVDLAESRLGQLLDKQDDPQAPEAARWHYIGRLQSRDAGRVAERCGAIHTLAGARAARRLAAQDARPRLFVQVNVDGDPAKDGLAPDDVEPFLLDLPGELSVDGLMAMPAAAAAPDSSRPAFAALRDLRDRLAPLVLGRHPLGCLSIGTSQDFEVAVEEGATHVRLGRILYEPAE